MNQELLKIPVSNEEVLKYDPMVHKIIKQEILKYWGSGVRVYSDDAVIGRLGMSFSDLMQYGRLLVCNQIRWYKANGLGPDGKPKEAKMTTLIFQQLRNKFMSLSKSFASEKHGGQIVNIDENKGILEKFVGAAYKPECSLPENVASLKTILANSTKNLQAKCDREFKDNEDLLKHVKNVLSNMDSVSFVPYEDIEGFSITSNIMNPEEALLAKEEIERRKKKICDRRGIKNITLSELTMPRRHTSPQFFPKGVSTLLMKIAHKQGIHSQRELSEQLGIGMTTLSNILRGRSKGTSGFRMKLENRFGKTFDELMAVVEV